MLTAPATNHHDHPPPDHWRCCSRVLTCHAVTRSILLAVDRTALRDLLEAGPA
jgi:hypothetical protein